MTLHEALVSIKENGPKIISCGICANARYVRGMEYAADVTQELIDLIEEWPELNGYPVLYPVGGAE